MTAHGIDDVWDDAEMFTSLPPAKKFKSAEEKQIHYDKISGKNAFAIESEGSEDEEIKDDIKKSEPLICYYCQEEGHRKFECPKKPKLGAENFLQKLLQNQLKPDHKGINDGKKADEQICFRCGENGHHSKDCTKLSNDVCFNCKQEGHTKRFCPQMPKLICNHCKQEGHIKNECPMGNKCFHCEADNHKSWQCPLKRKENKYRKEAGQKSGVFPKMKKENISGDPANKIKHKKDRCFNCQEIGHRGFDCPHPNVRDNEEEKNKCFNCKEIGHRLKDCPKPIKDQKYQDKCFNCQEMGHKSKDCTKPKVESKPKESKDKENFVRKVSNSKGGGRGQMSATCFNCKQEGHKSYACPKPVSKEGVKGIMVKKCFTCQEVGHKASDCPKSKSG